MADTGSIWPHGKRTVARWVNDRKIDEIAYAERFLL